MRNKRQREGQIYPLYGALLPYNQLLVFPVSTFSEPEQAHFRCAVGIYAG
ncbi:hypothetical protein NYE80_07945 [Paenibacillus sp. FSL H7-0357]|nr:hypothetical protein [Paenibacillus sp. FSL H7-0357]